MAAIVACIAFALSATQAHAQDAPPSTLYLGSEPDCREYWQDGRLKKPGDYGYGHRCLHDYYKQLYEKAECHCKTGACRPTTFRNSPNGREALIDGHWYTFDERTLRHKNQIPQELWPHAGHICAIPTGTLDENGKPGQTIECTIDLTGS